MPCICLACAQVRRAPVESFFIVIFDLIGLALEIVTGFRWQTPYPQIDKIFDKSSNSMSGHDHEENVHRRDLTNIPIVPVNTMWFKYSNIHHSTICSGFILAAIVDILAHYKYDVLVSDDEDENNEKIEFDTTRITKSTILTF